MIFSRIAEAAKDAFQDSMPAVLVAGDLTGSCLACIGVPADGKRRTAPQVLTRESVIHVYPNQCAILVDGGRVADIVSEAGYYQLLASSAESFSPTEHFGQRMAFGGSTPYAQKVFFLDMREIQGLKFGTSNPINYYDSFYDAELFIRTYGTFSVRITDPGVFYREVMPKTADSLSWEEMDNQYLAEFMEALGMAINRMAADGARISFLTSRSAELSAQVKAALAENWERRGFAVQTVALQSISYDAESQRLIQMRNQGNMMRNDSARKAFTESAAAEGARMAGIRNTGLRCDKCGHWISADASGALPRFCPQCGDPVDEKDRM